MSRPISVSALPDNLQDYQTVTTNCLGRINSTTLHLWVKVQSQHLYTPKVKGKSSENQLRGSSTPIKRTTIHLCGTSVSSWMCRRRVITCASTCVHIYSLPTQKPKSNQVWNQKSPTQNQVTKKDSKSLGSSKNQQQNQKLASTISQSSFFCCTSQSTFFCRTSQSSFFYNASVFAQNVTFKSQSKRKRVSR